MDEKPVNLLLIEDDTNDILIIKYFLGQNDEGPSMKIVTAETLETGCKLLEKESFDAVILDLGLPDSRGTQSLLRIRTQKPEMPVIVLTALQDKAVALEALSMGAQDYLIKRMINSYFLKESITHAIARARQATQFEKILAQDPDGKIIVNQAGLICYANPAAESFLGCGGEDLLGKPLIYPFPLPTEGSVKMRMIDSGAHEKLIEVSSASIEWGKTPVRLATLREVKPAEPPRKDGRRRHGTLVNGENG